MSKGFVEAVDKGLLGQVLNFAVEKAFGLPWLVNKAAEVTEVVVAGASGIVDRIASIPSGSIHATSNHTPIEGPKLGGNALKQANYVEDNSPYASNLNEVFAPAVPLQVARSTGVTMQAG